VWEKFFVERIAQDREAELVEVRVNFPFPVIISMLIIIELQKFAYLKATLYFLVAVLPSMASLATFVGYQVSGHTFTPTKAFVTLSLLNMIRWAQYKKKKKKPKLTLT
jgi:hypothetical protein